MRRLLPLLIIAALAVSLPAQVVGSSHDLRAFLSINQVCQPCHTPHNADPYNQFDDAIWNHKLPDGTLFTMYPQASVDGIVDPVPNFASAACLGCHDGVTGIDSYGGANGTQNFPVGDSRNVGQDLSDDHPVSIDYDYAGYHGGFGLKDPSTFFYGTGSPYLFDNKVECSSCHFVHGGGVGDEMLRMTMDASALCLGCHNE